MLPACSLDDAPDLIRCRSQLTPPDQTASGLSAGGFRRQGRSLSDMGAFAGSPLGREFPAGLLSRPWVGALAEARLAGYITGKAIGCLRARPDALSGPPASTE